MANSTMGKDHQVETDPSREIPSGAQGRPREVRGQARQSRNQGQGQRDKARRAEGLRQGHGQGRPQRQELGTAGPQRHRRPGRDGCPQTLHRSRPLHLRSRLRLDRSTQSSITYIDGDEGILTHRGYRIEDLAATAASSKSCYLLLEGELPTKEQLKKFEKDITYHTIAARADRALLQRLPPRRAPDGRHGGGGRRALAFYHDSTDIHDPRQRMIASHRLIGQGADHRRDGVQILDRPTVRLSAEQSFIRGELLRMNLRGARRGVQDQPVVAKAMDLIFILHADHEQNASTSTVRIAGSSGANPFACIAAGIACLWGPAHGGANEAS